MKFKQKQSKAREIMWLAVSAMALATAVHKTIYHSLATSWYYFAFVLVALAMFLLRRKMRINER